MSITIVFIIVFVIAVSIFLFSKGGGKLKEEEIIDRWSVLIKEANGKGKEVFRIAEENIKELKTPNVKLVRKEIAPTFIRKLKGEKRPFLVAENTFLKGYLMYIGAVDYGEQLFVSWYLTLELTGIRKFLAKLPWPLLILLLPIVIPINIYQKFKRKTVAPADMDIFDLEELTAYVTTVHHALIDATKEVSEAVGFDFTKVDQKSKGFLNIS